MFEEETILSIKKRLDLHFDPPQFVDKKDAAVLILLRGDLPKLDVFLCVRSMNLRKHPGEVCFPGGMWKFGDADLQETAMREAEEVGEEEIYV
ncbi:unnamed protein product, partial [Mesorhabditis belari]|uniref:Nudix hydrolase domain-containing protein n=1 Tax=Mesorhabditis belari TaxID=2138241 RepID=A0AAF3F6P3_9BILA